MRLLVLGSGGRLGPLLRARWPTRFDVAPVWHGGPDADLAFDILADGPALASAVARSDAILLLAGVTKENGSRSLSTNSDLAEAALAKSDGRPVLCCSTAAVYGRADGPLAEDAPLDPVTAYGASKREMERAALAYPNATILRIGNVAGADALLGIDRAEYTLTQFPDGSTPVRSFIGPALLAEVLAHLAHRAQEAGAMPRILNVAGPTPISMADLLQAAGKSWTATPATSENLKRVELDTKALWQLWEGPKPRHGATEIIADLRGAGGSA